MKTWFTSLNGAITLSVIALLTFLGRTLIDFRYVALEFEQMEHILPVTLPYTLFALLLFGGWLWALLAAVQGSRGGLIATLVYNLFVALLGGLASFLFLCPSPCSTGWPLAEIVLWANLIVGSIAAVAMTLQLRLEPQPTA
jgi:hypothetical protein